MNEGYREILSVIGPTASGKTLLSLELARRLGGEIISVDSRQVYRFMDIGTDKISREIREEIPHHLIDVVDPDDTFSAADFAAGAARAVEEIAARGRVPILAGGTPFYYRALFSDIIDFGVQRWDDTRREYEKEWDQRGSDLLYRKLESLDPVYAAKVHRNDRFRVIRALSIIDRTGKNPTTIRREGQGRRPCFAPLYVGLYPGRAELYRKIGERVREQFSSGYPEEVRSLLDRGYGPDLPSMRGFGYRELAAFHEGKISLEEALEGDIRATKAFSRRQMTWFRRFSPSLWYYVKGVPIQDTARKVVDLWEARKRGQQGI
ncbi:MAG TPA: tRNA (adenosine(37)-N6)-dimethylallyltransferase MiaA [Synergistaceae bacterium]|nr:tRNA (adenosine(37)-N6)-dimethylallyltransferase MiaA [Synergistaceae bacterium]